MTVLSFSPAVRRALEKRIHPDHFQEAHSRLRWVAEQKLTPQRQLDMGLLVAWSGAASRFYLRNPGLLQAPSLREIPGQKGLSRSWSRFRDRGLSLADFHQWWSWLIFAGELTGQFGVDVSTRGYSQLAKWILRHALSKATRALRKRHGEPSRGARFLLVAMGKLGGEELNLRSDVDLIATYSREGETRGVNSISHRDYFRRLVREMAKEVGDSLILDFNLRPRGADGDLVESLDALAVYYRDFAEGWERQALI